MAASMTSPTILPRGRVFNEDEVRALLEPLGLWPQVLSLDQAQLKQLLADAGVAADIRSRLQAMERVIATFPQLRVKKLG